jgi:Methylmalonyl Co-A mutase-associated GTPase MeaB
VDCCTFISYRIEQRVPATTIHCFLTVTSQHFSSILLLFDEHLHDVGAGKSTFIENLGMKLVKKKNRVAVIPVDPSSHISGGSILGDIQHLL